ncbi:MAG: hypothetical protein HC825_06765 [Oscillatoriales cyanobacterium RM1_1_9]|nr:hypothetical protein [Oscillatoriales cyanobacterium SM2_3_0]NJO45105.1 hypothetical protein [Oscillatoriales cyanobacterium RM2_1_1]NJO71462.1 hypothetical protein [Oscillatoriales cyanobacterium RM1_1_9]
MSLGPIEMLVVKFPGNQFKGEIVPALKELVDNSTIRVIDALFLRKDSNGDITLVEITELDDEDYGSFDSIVVDDIAGMLSESDAMQFAALLDPNTSAALMLFENTWATRFRDAIVNAKGQVLFSERIPQTVIETLTAEASETATV